MERGKSKSKEKPGCSFSPFQLSESKTMAEPEMVPSFRKNSPGSVNWLSEEGEKQLPFTSEVACHLSETHSWAD